MKLKFSGQFLEKYSNIKFHENPSIGSQFVPIGQTDGPTDMKKLIFIFRYFANTIRNTVTIKAVCKLCFTSVPLNTSETLESEEPIGMCTLPAIRWLLLCLMTQAVRHTTYCHMPKFSNIPISRNLYNYFPVAG